MNLTKYFMIELPMDDTFGPTDIPSIWNLRKYHAAGHTHELAGDSHDAYSVIIDSALGLLGAAPKNNDEFLGQVKWLQDYLSAKAAAEVSVADRRGARGELARRCSTRTARAATRATRTGTRMPLAEVGYRSRTARTPGTRTTPSRRTRW